MGRLNARDVKAYRTQLDRVATGEATPSEVQQDAAEQMSRHLPGFIQLMTHAYFELLNGLNDVRSAYEEKYLQDLLGMAKEQASEAAVALTLTGPSGTTATATLSVTNTTGQPARIVQEIFDVRRIDGAGPSLVPVVVFAPETLELGPNEEGTLSLSLQLDPARYDAGALYAGKLHLLGSSEVPLEVELRILATNGAPPSANSPQPA